MSTLLSSLAMTPGQHLMDVRVARVLFSRNLGRFSLGKHRG